MGKNNSPSCFKERCGEDVCVLCQRQGAPAGNLTAEPWQSCHSHGTPMLALSPKGKAEKLTNELSCTVSAAQHPHTR